MANKVGQFTEKEILTQSEAWAESLEVVEKASKELKTLFARPYQEVIFTGCGSTYYLSLAAAALFQKTCRLTARASTGGELLFNPETVELPKENGETLLVAISRSGSTTETVRAVEKFKHEKRGPVLVITNYADQPLGALGDLTLLIPKGQEESVAQTRSFASMYLAATAATMLAAGQTKKLEAMQHLPAIGDKLIAQYNALAEEMGSNLDYDRFYFLGNAGRYGLACEVNLKMKEMTLTHSEPFHFMDFRHGPMSMVTKKTVVVGLLSEKNRVQEQMVLDEMAVLGAEVISLGEKDARVVFNSGLDEEITGVLNLPILQLMGCKRSLAKGLNPDRPNNLSAVVKLNL
jgi:glucosamine--fructose-6-phosphate aminotransferase (isomerizing)